MNYMAPFHPLLAVAEEFQSKKHYEYGKFPTRKTFSI